VLSDRLAAISLDFRGAVQGTAAQRKCGRKRTSPVNVVRLLLRFPDNAAAGLLPAYLCATRGEGENFRLAAPVLLVPKQWAARLRPGGANRAA
jgi:hypothetical protein